MSLRYHNTVFSSPLLAGGIRHRFAGLCHTVERQLMSRFFCHFFIITPLRCLRCRPRLIISPRHA